MTSTTEAVVDVAGLRKHFGSVVALDGLDLQVHRGEVGGFLGPNGAGKSTTIRVLLGMYRSDGGSARLLGADPFRDAVALHRRLAYVPGDVTLWPHLTGGEAIDLLLSLRGVKAEAKARERLIGDFELDPTRRTATYSKGNRQKVALIAALAAPVELLVLDEPTSGLDPLMEEVFRSHIRAAAREGTSVLLSSHILSEVEELCDAVTIIREGKTVQAGSLDELRHVRRSTVAATVPSAEQARAELSAEAAVQNLQLDGNHLSFTADDADVLPLAARLRQLGASGVTITPPSLEELFLHQYRSPEAGA